jgi:hypothetical protein
MLSAWWARSTASRVPVVPTLTMIELGELTCASQGRDTVHARLYKGAFDNRFRGPEIQLSLLVEGCNQCRHQSFEYSILHLSLLRDLSKR